jgi:hypothetical protein
MYVLTTAAAGAAPTPIAPTAKAAATVAVIERRADMDLIVDTETPSR